MPNWKKIIVSGSDASLSSAYIEGNLTASAAFLTSASIGHLETIYETASVIYSSGSTKFGDTLDDTHEITGSLLVSSSITSISASIDNLEVYDKLELGGPGSQFFAYNEDTIKVKFANWYSSNDRQYGMGQLWFETWFAAIDNQASRDNRRIGFYLEEPDAGSPDSGTPGQHPSNARFYVDINGAYLSGSLNVEQSITGSEISASLIGTASIADFATTASHVIGGVTNSGSFSGSFEGDGSNLTGIDVSSVATITDNFTAETSVTVSHNFVTENVLVTAYTDNGEQLIPQTVRTLDDNNVGVDFATSTTGRIVVAKGGHIVSGSVLTASLAMELSNLATASIANTATTASHTTGTASISNLATTASIADLASTLSNTATASFADSATTASIADELSQLATASFADNATSASFAVTASYALNAAAGGGGVGYSNNITLSTNYTATANTYNSLYGPLYLSTSIDFEIEEGAFVKIEEF